MAVTRQHHSLPDTCGDDGRATCARIHQQFKSLRRPSQTDEPMLFETGLIGGVNSMPLCLVSVLCVMGSGWRCPGLIDVTARLRTGTGARTGATTTGTIHKPLRPDSPFAGEGLREVGAGRARDARPSLSTASSSPPFAIYTTPPSTGCTASHPVRDMRARRVVHSHHRGTHSPHIHVGLSMTERRLLCKPQNSRQSSTRRPASADLARCLAGHRTKSQKQRKGCRLFLHVTARVRRPCAARQMAARSRHLDPPVSAQ